MYSDHDIFYRELISNGCDAITKLKKLDLIGEYEAPDDIEYKIQYKKTIKNEEKLIISVKKQSGDNKDKQTKTLNIPKATSK